MTPTARVTLATLLARKKARQPISMLTAYDYPSAQIEDAAGVDCILVGDSAARVILGHGAIRLLLCDLNLDGGVMVTLQNGNLEPVRFDAMIDPVTNRTRIRVVDVRSDSYRVARAYMIRLEQRDWPTRSCWLNWPAPLRCPTPSSRNAMDRRRRESTKCRPATRPQRLSPRP